jgi:GMP synthase (glutamine-hydrolysing)
MRQIVIVKLGSTMAHLAQRCGDFEDLIRDGLAVDSDRIRVVNPITGDDLPDPATVAGVVLTGAHASVNAGEPWSERTAAWLPDLLAAKVLLLGICYGHQLLARAVGGTVSRLVTPEFGTVALQLTPAAASDPLFAGLPQRLMVQSTHTDFVSQLPSTAIRLAGNSADPNQAYAIGDSAWGVQFHPEFDAEVVRTYIRDWQDLIDLGHSHTLVDSVEATPESRTILSRFAELTQTASSRADR